jgi:hypothetical protein
MIAPAVSNYKYFYDTYDTFPQEIIQTDLRGRETAYNNSLFLFVPLGVERGTFAYRWFTEPMLRRDNSIALESAETIKKYSSITFLLMVLLFLQDLLMYYYAKAIVTGLQYKDTLKEGLIKGLWLDFFIAGFLFLKDKLTPPSVSQEEKVEQTASNQDKGGNNCGKTE